MPVKHWSWALAISLRVGTDIALLLLSVVTVMYTRSTGLILSVSSGSITIPGVSLSIGVRLVAVPLVLAIALGFKRVMVVWSSNCTGKVTWTYARHGGVVLPVSVHFRPSQDIKDYIPLVKFTTFILE